MGYKFTGSVKEELLISAADYDPVGPMIKITANCNECGIVMETKVTYDHYRYGTIGWTAWCHRCNKGCGEIPFTYLKGVV